ncbi:MAG: hypothetical protein ACRDGM_01465, partial [bacterium]
MALVDFQPEPTVEGFRQQMSQLVMDRKTVSESHFSGIRKEFPQLYDLYRGVYTGRYAPHKNT